MQKTRIKICGVRDADTARVAAEAGADAIGLVFVDGSPRQVMVDQAQTVIEALPAYVEPIALFVNASLDQVRQTTAALGIATVQLHGDEAPADAAALAPLRVIKAIAFTSRQVTAKLSPWRGTCANLIGILYDAPPPAADDGPTLPGGTGRTLDWQDLAKLEHGGVLAGLPPMVLAGGLNAANVGRAIELLQPYAVDVSSGVESSRGVKDAARITAFCRAVREADGVCAQRIQN